MSIRGVFYLAVLPLLSFGCQHYAREPLDVPGAYASWQMRTLDAEPLAAYASTLSAAKKDQSGPFNPADGISLREAQAIALWYNPELQVARKESALALSRARTAGIWPDAALDLAGGRKEKESEGGFLWDAGALTRSWVASGGIGVTIPLSGRISAERALRGAEHEASLLAVAQQETALLEMLSGEWIELASLNQMIQLHQHHYASLSGFAEQTQRLAAVGEMDPANARLFLLEQARINAKLQELGHLEKRQRLRLLSIMGLSPEAPATLLPDLSAPELPATELDDAALLAKHPRVSQLRMEYEASEERLRLEVQKQYPDITLGPGFASEDGERTQLLNLSLPIPVWNMNRGAIEEAAAGRDLARARVYAAYEVLLGELAQLREALAGAIALRSHLQDDVAPLADRQIEEAQALLNIGEFDASLLFNILSQVFEVKLEVLHAVAAQEKVEAKLFFMLHPPELPFQDTSNELRSKP